MKEPHPPTRVGRKRRATGWMLLALGVVVAGVWGASGWWSFSTSDDWVTYTVENGQLRRIDLIVAVHYVDDGRTYEVLPLPFHIRWRADRNGPPFTSMGWDAILVSRQSITGQLGMYPGDCIVLWPIPLLLWTPAALLLRSGFIARRRAMTNACTKCGYSLAGLGDGAACPECGKARPPEELTEAKAMT